MGHKPDGYNSVSPYLIVPDAAATIEFLRDVFDAVELRRIPGPDGRLRHAEVRLADSVVLLADAADGWELQPAHVHVYVQDVDAVHAAALEAGARSIQPPVRKDDPDRRGGVMDAGGTTWWIATQVA